MRARRPADNVAPIDPRGRGPVAQSVEQRVYTASVVGSNPAGSTSAVRYEHWTEVAVAFSASFTPGIGMRPLWGRRVPACRDRHRCGTTRRPHGAYSAARRHSIAVGHRGYDFGCRPESADRDVRRGGAAVALRGRERARQRLARRALILCGHVDTDVPGDQTAWRRNPIRAAVVPPVVNFLCRLAEISVEVPPGKHFSRASAPRPLFAGRVILSRGMPSTNRPPSEASSTSTSFTAAYSATAGCRSDFSLLEGSVRPPAR